MSNWTETQITAKGRALDAKVTAGTTSLQFTKMKLGSGNVQPEDIDAMTDLAAPRMNLGISSCAVSEADPTICSVVAIASSSDVQTSFQVKELGLFATDPDDGEILYAVMIDSAPDKMPTNAAPTPLNITFQINIVSDNASSITAVIDPAGLVSVSTLSAAINTHNTNDSAHPDLSFNILKRSHTYEVGDIAYSPLLKSWQRLECVQGGTTDSADIVVTSSTTGG